MTEKHDRGSWAVPQGRIPKVGGVFRSRGQYERTLRAQNVKAFDEALGDILGIGPPERPPPRVSLTD